MTNRRTGTPRWLIVLFCAALALALVGGALLWSHNKRVADDAEAAAEQAADTTAKNSALICSLGKAITDQPPLAPRSDETPAEFAQRVAVVRQFVRDLRELDDCDPEHPIRARVDPESRKDLERGREQRRADEGGDALRPDPPGRQPGPPGGRPPEFNPEPRPPREPPDDEASDLCDLWEETMGRLPAPDPVAPVVCP